MSLKAIQKYSPTFKVEIDRQEYEVELIASENYTSPAVLEVVGSPLTNKYAEGLPKRRYYGGCQHVDVIEKFCSIAG